jgi:hypothetical protein
MCILCFYNARFWVGQFSHGYMVLQFFCGCLRVFPTILLSCVLASPFFLVYLSFYNNTLVNAHLISLESLSDLMFPTPPASVSGWSEAEPSRQSDFPAVHQSPKKKKRKKVTVYTKSDEEVWDLTDSIIIGTVQAPFVVAFNL